jgi:hypothetical protein
MMLDALTEIVVNGRPLREVTQEAFETLALSNEPPALYVRSGRLARVRRDEKARPFIEELNENHVRHHLARCCEFVRVGDKGVRTLVHPPPAVVGDLMALLSFPGLPALEALTEVPCLRPDGTVLDTPGYDAATGLVYVPAPGLRIPSIPREPTQREARRAIKTIAELFVDMPFVGKADCANLLGLLLTPIVRPAIAGQVPMALVDKPKRGSGATLCVQVVTAIALGSVTELTTAPQDDEEWRKKITSALLAGSTFLWFDNVESKLSSASLAAVLTAPEWKDRILGKSEMTRSLPNRATWAATGNNLQVGGDLGRRCYRIRIDAGVAQPWTRNGFRHPQLLRHVRAHRGTLLAAILTLARGWFVAGCPRGDVPVVGSFEEWAQTIGGILTYAGVSDFLANLSDFYDQVDEDEAAWAGFLAAWYAHFGAEAVLVATIREALEHAQDLREALPPDLLAALEAQKAQRDSFSWKLGKALASRVGAVFGTFRLEKVGVQHRRTMWRVVPHEGQARRFDDYGGLFSPGEGGEFSSHGSAPGETDPPRSSNRRPADLDEGADGADGCAGRPSGGHAADDREPGARMVSCPRCGESGGTQGDGVWHCRSCGSVSVPYPGFRQREPGMEG